MQNVDSLYEIFLAGSGVVTDSRAVREGSLFFALKGDNFDGNAYADRALQAGASCAVVDDPTIGVGRAGYFLVDNVLATLQALAAYHRERLGIPIVALTGSNGKTTTKEFLRLALSCKYTVGSTQGNFNNHIGVPLTLLSFDSRTELGIVEMGANHVGEIASLCAIAKPGVGLITNVGRAHLEGFGGEQGVRRAKGELYDFLAAHDAVAIYNQDDVVLGEMVSERESLRSVGYRVQQSDRSALFGAYNALNVGAALAVAEYFGVDLHDARLSIATYVPTNNRSQVIDTALDNRVVADCYNANPSSMKAALDEFLALQSDREKVLILGQMGELGMYSEAEHKKLVEMAKNCGQVYLVGLNFSNIVHGGMRVFADVSLLKSHLVQDPIVGKLILLKGSRSVRLEQILEII